MVDIDRVFPEGATVAGPYSPGVKVGNLIFISGQVPALLTSDIKEQTQSTLEKIKEIIEAAGGSISNIVKTTIFMKDIKEFTKMNKTYKEFFEKNGVTETFPARSTVEVSNFPLLGMLIEIEAIAVLK